jgi:S-DNA-T family DNA segregation ATPase FtsK/SpoIIIE
VPSELKPNELLFCENVIVDMNKFPHCLIGGDTGTGKSRVLLTILTQLISYNDNVDLHLLQVRKNDLGVFKNCKQVKTFSKTLDDVLDCLVDLDEELQEREKLIDNFTHFHFTHLRNLKYHKNIIYAIVYSNKLKIFAEMRKKLLTC